MLKMRIIPTLLHKDFGLVKGIKFDSWRRIGSVIQAVKVYNLRQVDELLLLDISATPQNREPDYDLIDDVADECFMPLTVGGGIKSIDQIEKLLTVGADKVLINTAATLKPSLISDAARTFGSQCITIGVDVKRTNNAKDGYLVAISNGKVFLNSIGLHDHLLRIVDSGAGEIVVTSIDREGTMKGFDLELARIVRKIVPIPVVISGGAGSINDFHEVARTGVDAISASSLFQFTETTPLEVKHSLLHCGFPLRLN